MRRAAGSGGRVGLHGWATTAGSGDGGTVHAGVRGGVGGRHGRSDVRCAGHGLSVDTHNGACRSGGANALSRHKAGRSREECAKRQLHCDDDRNAGAGTE